MKSAAERMSRTGAYRPLLWRSGLLWLLVACSGEGRDALPKGDAAIIEAAARGDSLARMSALGAAIAESLANVPSGELDANAIGRIAADLSKPDSITTATAEYIGGGQRMTARALARGDSLARAAAESVVTSLTRDRNRSRADTLRGIITLEYEDFVPSVQMIAADSRIPIALSGMATAELSTLEGLEVTVRGVRVGVREIAVSAFHVRASGGVPTDDGILATENGGFVLRTNENRRVVLERVPAELRELVGKRVWVARNASVNPSFGVIARRR